MNILVWRSLRTLEWSGTIEGYECWEGRINSFIEWRNRDALVEDLGLILIKFLDKRRLIIGIE